MTVSTDFLEYVRDLLAPLGPVTARRVFGSVDRPSVTPDC